MNRYQKWAILLGWLTLLVVLIYPPIIVVYSSDFVSHMRTFRHSILWFMLFEGEGPVLINYNVLFVELMVVFAFFAGAVVVFRSRENQPAPSEGNSALEKGATDDANI